MAREASIDVRELSAPAAAPLGLTSDEARRRLGEFGANVVGEAASAALAGFPREILVTGPVDAGGCVRSAAGARRLCRSSGDRRPAPVQRSIGLSPGGPRKRRVGRTQEAAGADRLGAPRRRVGEAAGVRVGARRCDQAAARRTGSRRRGHRFGIAAGRPVDAHRRSVPVDANPGSECSPVRWCVAARPSPK